MIDISKIRVVPGFPTEGIQFYDITTILNDPDTFRDVIESLLEEAKKCNPDVIVALEARGYFFAPSLALALNIPFVPIRKKGKLPFSTYTESYNLEYGQAAIEIHTDAIKPNQKVLLFDDVLATGGTAKASINLIQNFKPKSIHTLFLMELLCLNGRKLLGNCPVTSLLSI